MVCSKFPSHLFLVLAVAFLGQCVSSSQQVYIDLTYSFNNETVTYKGREPTFKTEFEGELAPGMWAASRSFCTSEHTSTHIDAPYHLWKTGIKLHEILLTDLFDVPGVLIDVYDKVHEYKNGALEIHENYGLTREDILEWEGKYGEIPQGAVVLMRSGWGNRWPDKYAYRGSKNQNKNETVDANENIAEKVAKLDANYPGISPEAARFLAVERQIRGAGVDTLSVDPADSKTGGTHKAFASRNIYMLENVAHLHLLPPTGFRLWIVPIKIDYGTGAPARIFAKLNK